MKVYVIVLWKTRLKQYKKVDTSLFFILLWLTLLRAWNGCNKQNNKKQQQTSEDTRQKQPGWWDILINDIIKWNRRQKVKGNYKSIQRQKN